MDVYARVFINKKYIRPIIFENKTNTFLHNNQLERYCDMVYGWFWDKPDEALEIQKKAIARHENIDVESYKPEIGKTQYIMFKLSEIFHGNKMNLISVAVAFVTIIIIMKKKTAKSI